MALHQLPLYEGVITRRLLRRLAEIHRPGELLPSVYLDMDPSRWGDAEGVRIAAKNSLRQLHEHIRALPIANGERQRLLHETDLIQEVATLTAGRRNLRSLACFVASALGVAYALPLPWPNFSRHFLEDRFVLWPLHQALDQSDPFGLILVDKDEARLYLGYLGQVEERTYIFDEVPPKIRIPDAFGELEFRRKQVVYFHRHFDRVAYTALRLWEQEPFRHLIIGGLWEVLPQFERHLHRYLHEHIVARWEISVHAPKEELQRRLEEEEKRLLERQAELIWHELAEAPPERQARGPERVFRALWEQRVGYLLIHPNTHYHGHVCTQCQRLHLSGGPCIECGGSVAHVPDIYEEAARVALAQSAHVRYWTAQALEECDGIAALLRY